MSSNAAERAAIAEMRQRFGDLLGADANPSEAAFRAAVDDPVYARHLLGSRGASEVVKALLEAPPPAAPEHSGVALVARASKAMARWAAAGFATVDAAALERRLAACSACVHLRVGSERGVCGLCGCPVARKAKLATESCPGAH